jgi:Protein of unknown function (DUF3500)
MGCRAPQVVNAMRAAAVALVESLDDDQRSLATAPFDTPDHRQWTYLPGSRAGLALLDMGEHQRSLAIQLLETGLSAPGLATALDIMTLDGLLRDLERDGGRSGWERRHPRHYWVRVLGDPASQEAWAWRVNGHHLAVHMTVVGDRIAGTPQFFGANPAVVPEGPRAGWRLLPQEELVARDLVSMLDRPQRSQALVAAAAPRDIATRDDPVAEIGVVPVGLGFAQMSPTQQETLAALIRHYLDRVVPELAAYSWAGLVDAGLDEVSFAWTGGLEPGQGHYYAVRGRTFLIEYDNVQNNANHIHTVWRDVHHDWGRDLLAEHHAAVSH